jgi:hypothetical protein
MDPDNYVNAHGPELFRAPWETARPWFSYLLEELVGAHGLEIDGRLRVLEELRPYFQILEPVEQSLWLKLTSERLKVEETQLRLSLAAFSPLSPARLDPASRLAVSLERGLLCWVLRHPQAVLPEELEEWAQDFENPELKRLLTAIIHCCREHGVLDHGLLLQQVEEAGLRQQICALTLGEEECFGPSADQAAAQWRRDLHIRRLKKARARLKEELELLTATGGGEDLAAILAQRREIDRQLEALKIGASPKGENG